MYLPQKVLYGLRALLELARRHEGQELITIGEIAQRQAIPQRFLEGILNQLRSGGFVESRRGKTGGYVLARPPEQITMGEVIEFLHGPLRPVKEMADNAFLPTWEKAQKALLDIFNQTTFRDLLEQETHAAQRASQNYSI